MGIAAGLVGGQLISGVIGARAAGKAAGIQAGAADRASQLQYQQFQEAKGMLDPYIQGGLPAFQRQQALSGALGAEAQEQAYQQFRESPGVAWQRAQGMRGIEAGLAQTGRGGGTRLRAMGEFNQNLALQDFGNQFNRLGSLTGVGLTAARALTGAGAASAAGQAQTTMQAGQARAGGVLGRGQAFGSTVQGLGNIYAMQQAGLFS